MSVYVDDMMAPFRGMLMSHLVADTAEELQAFAARLGLPAAWYQAGGYMPHYDVSAPFRGRAIGLGAVPVQFGREPYRCNTCDLITLSCVPRMRCECPSLVA